MGMLSDYILSHDKKEVVAALDSIEELLPQSVLAEVCTDDTSTPNRVWIGTSEELWKACDGQVRDIGDAGAYGSKSRLTAGYELYGPFDCKKSAKACTKSSRHPGRLRGVYYRGYNCFNVRYWESDGSSNSYWSNNGDEEYWALMPVKQGVWEV